MPKNSLEIYQLASMQFSLIFQQYQHLIEEIRENLPGINIQQKQSQIENCKYYLIIIATALYEEGTWLKNNNYPNEGEEALKKANFLFEHFKMPLEQASVLNNLAVHYEKLEKYQDAFKCYQTAVEMLETLSNCSDLDLLANVFNGYAAHLQSLYSDTNKSIAYYRKALVIREKLRDESPRKLAKTHVGLSVSLFIAKQPKEAKEHAEKGLAILECEPIQDPQLLKQALISLAQIYEDEAHAIVTAIPHFSMSKAKFTTNLDSDFIQKNLGHTIPTRQNVKSPTKILNEAFQILKKSLLLLDRVQPLDDSKVSLILISLRYFGTESENYKEAEIYGQRLLALARKIEKTPGFLVKIALIGMANNCEKIDRFQEAIAFYEEARLIETPKDQILDKGILVGLGFTYKSMSRFQDAAECYEKVLESDDGENSATVAETLNNLASIYEALDNYEKMYAYATRAIEIYKNVFGSDSAEVAAATMNLGVFHEKTGTFTEAEIHYQKTLRITVNVYGEESRQAVAILNNLGLHYYRIYHNEKSAYYFEKALIIANKLWPDGSSEMTALLTNYADLLLQTREYDQAETYFNNAMIILKRVNLYHSQSTTKALDGLGVLYMKRGDYQEARKYLEKSLQIKRQLYRTNSTEIAETLTFLAEISEADEQAIDYYHEAIKHYENCQFDDSYTACEARLNLARLYQQRGMKQEQSVLKMHDLDSALKIYFVIFNINRKLIKYEKSNFSTFDLIEHLSLLDKITYIFCLKGETLQAAEFFANEAKELADLFPEISLQCVNRALEFYSNCTNTKMKRVELLAFKITLYKNQTKHLKPWQDIRNTLDEIQILDPQYDIKPEIKLLETEFKEFSENLEEDLRLQFERCVDISKQLEYSFLRNAHKKSSDYEHNKTAELFISLRNILDQAFGRLVTRIIIEPHKRKTFPFYFPLRHSLKSFYQYLGKLSLLNKHILIAEENFSLQNPDKKHCPDPPSIKIILTCLLNAGILINVDGCYQLKNNTLPKNITWKPDDLQVYPALLSYHSQILKKLKLIFNQAQHGLDNDCQASYELLLKMQPFYYFDELNNITTPGLYQTSWLEKLTAINNDYKHMRLVPTEAKYDLKNQKGTIKKATREIKIQYLEKRLYPWIFIDILPDDLSYTTRLQLSKKIIKLLKLSGHIKNNIASHKLAKDYHDAKCQNQALHVVEEIRLAYLAKIKISLIVLKDNHQSLFDRIVENICDFMLCCSSHQGNINFLEANASLSLFEFIKKSLSEIYRLLNTFGKEVRLFCNIHSSISVPIWSKQNLRLPINLEYFEWQLATESFDATDLANLRIGILFQQLQAYDSKSIEQFTWNDMKTCHRALSELTLHLKRKNKYKTAGDIYFKTARKLEKQFPELAIYYLENAIDSYRTIGEYNEIKNIQAHLSHLYECQLLIRKAMSPLINEKQNVVSFFHFIRYAELQNYYNNKNKSIDNDIVSQLEYLKEELFILKRNWLLQSFMDPDFTTISFEIRARIFELMIKIRHLIDHAFRRLLVTTVLNPNQEYLSNALLYNYPVDCNTEKELRIKLKSCLAIENSLDKANLDETLIRMIQATQTEQWLKMIVKLTNLAKHEKFPNLSWPDFQALVNYPANQLETQIKLESDISVIPLLTQALSRVTEIINRFFEVINSFEKKVFHQPILEMEETETHLPLDAEGLKNKGNFFAAKNQHLKALTYYDQAITVNPGLARAWFNKGLMHKSLRQYTEALHSFQQAYSLDTNYIKAKIQYAQCLILIKAYEQAYTFFGEILKKSDTIHPAAVYGQFNSSQYFGARIIFTCLDIKLTEKNAVRILDIRSGMFSTFDGLLVATGQSIQSAFKKAASKLNLPDFYIIHKPGDLTSNPEIPSELRSLNLPDSANTIATIRRYKAICCGAQTPKLSDAVLVEGDIIVDYILSRKELLQSTFEQANLSSIRPKTKSFKYRYHQNLSREILAYFPETNYFCLRNPSLNWPNNIIIVPKEELDLILPAIMPGTVTTMPYMDSYILYLKNKYKHLTDETLYNEFIKPIIMWSQSDTVTEFLVEEYVQNKPVRFQNKNYDGTLRVAVLVIRDQNQIRCEPIASFWRLPSHAIDDSCNPIKRTIPSKAMLSVALDPQDENNIYQQLRDSLPGLMQTMFGFTVERLSENYKDTDLGNFFLRLGNTASYRGEYLLAEYFFSQAEPLLPNNYRVDHERGILHHFKEAYSKAISYFLSALRKERGPATLFRLGQTYLAMRNFSEAFSCFTEAFELDLMGGEYQSKVNAIYMTDLEFQDYVRSCNAYIQR